MSYLVPTDVVEKMVIAGAMKMNMTTKTTLIRAIMAGAILGLAAVFAITVAIKKWVSSRWCCVIPSRIYYANPIWI
jgi:Formate/nitrite transporter.